MQIDRLRWLVLHNKHLTIDGAAEIARSAPSILRLLELGIKSQVVIHKSELINEAASPKRLREQ